MASPFQYFGDQCCIESLGKLPPKGLGHYIVNVSAISPNSLLGLPGATAANTGSSNITTRRAGRPRTGNAGNGCPQSLSVFFFFGEGCEDPLLLLPGCGGRTQHTEGSQQQRTTRRPTSSPEKRTRESLAERRCGRWGDRWSGPRKRHRRTSSYERRRALCGPVPRTRSGSADVPVAVPHGAPGALQGQRRAHWGCRPRGVPRLSKRTVRSFRRPPASSREPRSISRGQRLPCQS